MRFRFAFIYILGATWAASAATGAGAFLEFHTGMRGAPLAPQFAADTADHFGSNWKALRIPLSTGQAFENNVPAFFTLGLQTWYNESFEIYARFPLRKDLEALDAKLQKDGALMSETEQSEQVRKLKSLQAQLQIEGQSLEDDSRRRQAEERNALLQKVKTAIDAVAAREGYDIIMQGGGVVYAKPNMDLSEKVIAEITKK